MEKFRVETKRLILRPFTMQDAEEYFSITRDKDVQRYVPNACPATFADCLDDIANIYSKGDFSHDYYVIIEEKISHAVIGAIICVQIHDFDTSCLLGKEYRHQGYMLEAMEAFIAHMPKGGALIMSIHYSNDASLKNILSIRGIEEITCTRYPYDPNVRKFLYVL